LDTLPGITDVDKKETLRFFEILGSEEYETFINTYTQELKSTYKQTGMFNFHFQKFFDFFTSQCMPEFDLEVSLRSFKSIFQPVPPKTMKPKWAFGSKRSSLQPPVPAPKPFLTPF